MPPNRLSRLPSWASRWLGYRAETPAPLPSYVVYLWSFIAAFTGLVVLQAIFHYSHYFTARHVPGLVASYGASAVLVYGTPHLPLAQPRSLVGGHFLGALVGICITKLFSLMPSEARFESLRWLAASLSTAVAIVLMLMTGTTHPPAGATALMPALDDKVWELSWYFLPIVLLSSTLVLAVALLFNNVQRVYPVFWFEPPVVPAQAAAAPSPPPRSERDAEEGRLREESDVDEKC